MKKFLLFILFVGSTFMFSGSIKAQVSKTNFSNTTSGAKSDDGVMIVSPNPARDFIVIKTKDASTKIKSVAFFSILGVQVAEYQVNMSSAEIRLDKLKAGKYLMRYILDDNTQRVTQIIKQ